MRRLKAAMKKVILAALICYFSLHCGYHLRGTGSFLPGHIKKISIPMFKNLTTRFELDLKITQSVIDEFVTRGKVEITPDIEKADAVLIGEIVSFAVNPIAFSGQGMADRYSITVVAKIVLRDLVKQRVIFSNPSFPYVEEYQVPEGADFESMETEAINKVAEKFARSLVITLLEGF